MDARTHAVAEALAEVRYDLSSEPRLLAADFEREATEFLAMLKAVRDFDRDPFAEDERVKSFMVICATEMANRGFDTNPASVNMALVESLGRACVRLMEEGR